MKSIKNAVKRSQFIQKWKMVLILMGLVCVACVFTLFAVLRTISYQKTDPGYSEQPNQDPSKAQQNNHDYEGNITDLKDLQLEFNLGDQSSMKTPRVTYWKVSSEDRKVNLDDPHCCGKGMIAFLNNSRNIEIPLIPYLNEVSSAGDLIFLKSEKRIQLNDSATEIETIIWSWDMTTAPKKIFTIKDMNKYIASWEISANNKWIAVLTGNRNDDNAPQELWIVKADGTEQKQLTTPTPNNLTNVTWSKDSLQIYLDSSNRITTDSVYFYVVNVENETIIPTQIKNLPRRIRISTNGATDESIDGGKIFSPNRSHIAYVARTSTQIPYRVPSYAVRIKNIQTGATADLIETPFEVSNLLWSEDGRTLLYSLDKEPGDTNDGIYLLDLSSSSSRQIIASGEKAKLIPKLWIDKDNIIVIEELFDENGENILKTNLLLINSNGVKKRTIDSSLIIKFVH